MWKVVVERTAIVQAGRSYIRARNTFVVEWIIYNDDNREAMPTVTDLGPKKQLVYTAYLAWKLWIYVFLSQSVLEGDG